MDKIFAIITAGGSGKRIGGKTKKQFQELCKRPLLFWTLDPFVSQKKIDRIIITLPQQEIGQYDLILRNEFPNCDLLTIVGGHERQDSVRKALIACGEPDPDYVLIHDAVRPFITSQELVHLILEVKTKKAVIPVCRIKDTIKFIEKEQIIKTLDRQKLYSALTPQVFSYQMIRKYHEKAFEQGLKFTDDASILEHFGIPVHVRETSSLNFKITNPQDLKLAEIMLKNFWE